MEKNMFYPIKKSSLASKYGEIPTTFRVCFVCLIVYLTSGILRGANVKCSFFYLVSWMCTYFSCSITIHNGI